MSNRDYCIVCGIKHKSGIINDLIYPKYKFKEGVACYGCGSRLKEKNMKARGLRIKRDD